MDKIYRYIGAAIVVMAVVLFTAVAYAGQACVPLEQVAKDLEEAKVPKTALSKLVGDDIAGMYLAATGAEVPKDIDPIGLLFVTITDKVMVLIVESGGCVKYSFVIPQATHEAAMNHAASSI